MKHIQKKFLNQKVLSEGEETVLKEHMDVYHADEIGNINKNRPHNLPVLITTTKNITYQAFQIKVGKEIKIIPEPDPILVYYHTAYINYRQLAEKKKALLEFAEEINLTQEPVINQLYEFFGMVTSVVIFLFTTLEATTNRCIPKKYKYERVLPKKTEIFTKEQIEFELKF